MSEFTYELENRETRYETYEWDNTWIDHANDMSLKRVLYIGDSISCGIRKFATEKADGKFVVDLFGTSRALDNPYFKDALSIFAAQQEKRDMVLINNGLHGGHLDDETDYRRYYEEMIEFLLNKFKDTPLAIVLTTFVNRGNDLNCVLRRNKVAMEIAEKYRLPVIDLFSVSKSAADLLKDDGIHFTDKGYELLADKIVESVLKLKKEY